MNKDIRRKRLLDKYLKNECTEEELQELITYFKDADRTELPGVEEVLNQLDDEVPALSPEADSRMYNRIVNAKDEKRKRSFKEEYKALSLAAVFIGLLLVSYFYKDLVSPSAELYNHPAETQVTLRLGDGRLEQIESTNKVILDTKGKPLVTLKENKLVYDTESQTDSLIYNELSVPYGKTFNLLLADGTQVHLNAGSSIRFPVKFLAGKPRKVFLQGEAYFGVVRDEHHPFIVSADELNIEVLGTEFNVMAYPDEQNAQVVLVEGSVGMSIADNRSDDQIVLSPGQLGVLDRNNKHIVTDQVSTTIYTSWMRGELVFRHLTFEAILKRLERHYNVKIENHFKAAHKETFNANFGEESIEQVLDYFSAVYNIEYTIEGNNIRIES